MTTVATPPRRLGATMRRDLWWVQPVLVVTALTLFGIYTLIRVIFVNKYFAITADGAHLQSPFFSPDLPGIFSFNTNLPWALLVLWAPLGLRTTCYYYRKSYYRSFFLAPPSCAVAGVARRKYSGETKFPLVLNNLHRIFFYFAAIVVGVPLVRHDPRFLLQRLVRDRGRQRIMFINVICLSAFTFGCNSWRHIIGGKLNCFSCSPSADAATRPGRRSRS